MKNIQLHCVNILAKNKNKTTVHMSHGEKTSRSEETEPEFVTLTPFVQIPIPPEIIRKTFFGGYKKGKGFHRE